MRILADRAVPFLEPCFADLGDLDRVDARDIDPRRVREAEALVVRTVTRVDEILLGGSRVRFVASPASGIDHVDTAYLAAAGIGFAHAPGCNARAVAEYVLSGLFALPAERGFDPARVRAGIVGCGHAGSALASLLDALGIPHLDCDPPLAETGRSGSWHGLPDLQGADFISLHVPLTDSGPHATRGMVGTGFLSGLRNGAVLVNASRGGVVDERALRQWLDARRGTGCIVDVWEHEPGIDTGLLRRVTLGTPHIAGYSLDARLRATASVARATRRFFGLPPGFSEPPLAAPARPEIRIDSGIPDTDAVRTAVLGAYDIRADAVRLRPLPDLEAAARPAFFADLRNNYPVRREFTAYTVRAPAGRERLRRMLEGLGFRVRAAG
jgi:erythronate-4-phosphate dehydrogenase